MNENNDSSMDELAMSQGLTYPSPKRIRVATPLAQRSPNIRRQQQLNFDVTPALLRGASPSKSMILDPSGQYGAPSPWQIKVTVEAEPRGGSPSRLSAARSRVTRIPLKDADSSPSKPTRKGLAKRKPDADSAIKKRKGTPLRRRSSRISGGRSSLARNQEHEAPVPEMEVPLERKRGRPRKSTPVEELVPEAVEKVSSPRVSRIQTLELSEEEVDLGAGVGNGELGALQMDDPHNQQGINDGYNGHNDDDDEAARREFEEDFGPASDPASDDTTEKSPEPSVQLPSKRSDPFDFTKLTPLHVKHPTLPPAKQSSPNPRHPIPRLTDGDYYQPPPTNRIAFSPLPKRATSARHSSVEQLRSPPQTQFANARNADAQLWRAMISQKRRGTPIRKETTPDFGSDAGTGDDSDEDSDGIGAFDEPELTTRTVGETTMMQSEDFSIVSLSSLPSAKDGINSSMLGHSAIDHSESHLDRSAQSHRQPSKLNQSYQLSSSPELPRQIKDITDQNATQHMSGVSESHISPGLRSTPQKRAKRSVASSQPQKSSSQSVGFLQGEEVIPEPGRDIHNSAYGQNKTPDAYIAANTYTSSSPRFPSSVSRPQNKTPIVEEGRLPTPNSAEYQISPPQNQETLPPSDISYPDINPAYPVVDHSPSKSESGMTSPPATPLRSPEPTSQTTQVGQILSSGTKRSWIDEPTPAHIVALERKWQQERENVKRTLAVTKDNVITIESDLESSSDEDGVDEEQASPPPAPPEAAEDIWEDISRSYEEEESQLSRRSKPEPVNDNARSQPSIQQRPSKIARTQKRFSPGSTTNKSSKATVTPKKQFSSEQGLASVDRRNKAATDISAIFNRLGRSESEDSDSAFVAHESPNVALSRDRGKGKVYSPKQQATAMVAPEAEKPSRLKNAYKHVDVNETDISALSDVRQLRNEAKQATRRPPFPVVSQKATMNIPTKLTSVDDTVNIEDEQDQSSFYDRSSLLSIDPHPRPSRNLFSESAEPESEPEKERSIPQAQFSAPARRHPQPAPPGQSEEIIPTTKQQPNLLTRLWQTITLSTHYSPPPRPIHPSLSDPERYPLLPKLWPWSHTHWATLDSLYQYYKRKPSRFSPTRTRRPANIGILTPAWEPIIDIQFRNWGYNVRLDAQHILLACLFCQLLVLEGGEREFAGCNAGRKLEWGVQDQGRRVGERITEWDVVVRVFGIVAGELMREDEMVGRRVRREEDLFMYRLKGEEWRRVVE